MEKLKLEELSLVDTEKVSSALFQSIRTFFSKNMMDEVDMQMDEDTKVKIKVRVDEKNYHIYAVVYAYILYKMQSTVVSENYDEFWKKHYEQMPEEIRVIMIKYGYPSWEVIKNLIGKFSLYELLAFILFDNKKFDSFLREDSTPKGVLKLCNHILDIKDDDNVLEICSGKGNFFVEATLDGMKANYVGIEIDRIINDIAVFRAALIRENFQYINQDVFCISDTNKIMADKIFSNHPFGLKKLTSSKNQVSIAGRYNLPGENLMRVSSDWIFNLEVINSLKKDGKAVVIMLDSSTWNECDKKVRRYFVTEGLIETVIALPANIFGNSALPTSLVVLSRNNKNIAFVDARDNYTKGRKKNEITDQDVSTIIRSMKGKSKNVTVKKIEEIAEKDFSLKVDLYLGTDFNMENGVPFERVIKSIQRGFQSKVSELEEYRSEEPTNFKVLQLAHINDGLISIGTDVEYVKEDFKKFGKFMIKNHSLVISKTGSPAFKSAIVEKDDDENWIASSNLLVVELDEEKINPFYLQAFLVSDMGVAMLNSVHTGSIVPSISKANLTTMTIPLPSRNEQDRIANEFIAALNEVVELRKQLEKSMIRMKKAFDGYR